MSKSPEETLDALIDASAGVLGIPLEPDWRPGIEANLRATLRLAALFDAFELLDEAEPAPVFEA